VKKRGGPRLATRPFSLADYAESITDYVVRTAELILFAGAFGYAAVRSGSIPAGIISTLFVMLAGLHLGARPLRLLADWVNHQRRSGGGVWGWAVFACAGAVALAAGVTTGAAVMALVDVIIATAGL
jgi:hypothetical protein